MIIGIDYKDVRDGNNLKFQVLFEQPSFGKDDLGGLVDYLWGGSYTFDQLFNIDSWVDYLEPREGGDKPGFDLQEPRFVNSDEFHYKKKSEVVDFDNYEKLANLLQLEPKLMEIIKEAAKKYSGSDWRVVTNKGQRHMNNLQPHESTLLDKTKELVQVKYVAKEEEDLKTESKVDSKGDSKGESKGESKVESKGELKGDPAVKPSVDQGKKKF